MNFMKQRKYFILLHIVDKNLEYLFLRYLKSRYFVNSNYKKCPCFEIIRYLEFIKK